MAQSVIVAVMGLVCALWLLLRWLPTTWFQPVRQALRRRQTLAWLAQDAGCHRSEACSRCGGCAKPPER